ncbi:MAG: hypothetical protein WDO24_23380 [Pseudomonadota bacterium]
MAVMDDDAPPPRPARILSRRELIALLILVALAVAAALPELRRTYAGAVLTEAARAAGRRRFPRVCSAPAARVAAYLGKPPALSSC